MLLRRKTHSQLTNYSAEECNNISEVSMKIVLYASLFYLAIDSAINDKPFALL